MTASGWLIPILATVLLGFGATYYLRKVRLPPEERAAGIASLADMRWRAFIKLVLDALERRGYQRLADSGDAASDGDHLLEHEGERWLLSSRHGASSLLDAHTLGEFANDMRMRSATGGLLVTPGKFAPEIVIQARERRIQLLDAPTLWPELRALLADEQIAAVAAPVRNRNRQQVMLAWLGALAVGMLLAWTLGRSDADSTTGMPPSGAAANAPKAAATITPPPNAVPNTAPLADDGSSPAPTDPTELANRRSEVVKLTSTLRHVDRAVWSTQSTLLVYMLDDSIDPVSELCPILLHYEELRTSRLQLQPPQGSSKPVRFLQCRSS